MSYNYEKAHPDVEGLMCSGKKSYRSHKAAKEHLTIIRTMKKGMGDSLHVYRCPYCWLFHIGSKN